jgi:hypothetical protein
MWPRVKQGREEKEKRGNARAPSEIKPWTEEKHAGECMGRAGMALGCVSLPPTDGISELLAELFYNRKRLNTRKNRCNQI